MIDENKPLSAAVWVRTVACNLTFGQTLSLHTEPSCVQTLHHQPDCHAAFQLRLSTTTLIEEQNAYGIDDDAFLRFKLGAELAHFLMGGGVVSEEEALVARVDLNPAPEARVLDQREVALEAEQAGVRLLLEQRLEVAVIEDHPLLRPALPALHARDGVLGVGRLRHGVRAPRGLSAPQRVRAHQTHHLPVLREPHPPEHCSQLISDRLLCPAQLAQHLALLTHRLRSALVGLQNLAAPPPQLQLRAPAPADRHRRCHLVHVRGGDQRVLVLELVEEREDDIQALVARVVDFGEHPDGAVDASARRPLAAADAEAGSVMPREAQGVGGAVLVVHQRLEVLPQARQLLHSLFPLPLPHHPLLLPLPFQLHLTAPRQLRRPRRRLFHRLRVRVARFTVGVSPSWPFPRARVQSALSSARPAPSSRARQRREARG
eukprot:172049-Rhodomonas_salina.2